MACLIKKYLFLYKNSTIQLLLSIFCFTNVAAQQAPYINIINPSKQINQVANTKQFIIGNTCKNCVLTINSKPVKVYTTGAFAMEINLLPGDTTLDIRAENEAKVVSKKISFLYTPTKPPTAVTAFDIENIQIFPEGNLIVSPGDIVKFKVKALPNCTVKILDNIALFEMPPQLTNGLKGMYQGEYTIKETDTFNAKKIKAVIIDSFGNKKEKYTSTTIQSMHTLLYDVAITKGKLAHLEFGLGDDRLGGAKIGYLDSNILLKIIGKVGTHFKIKLAKNRIAYIPEELVNLLPKGSFAPESLTAKCTVYGDEDFDYVKLALFNKLPYQSAQQINPSTITVDIFGATNNTNWITHLQSAQEIKYVDYEQITDDIFRLTIQLKHAQHWGHQINYVGNNLVIKVKRQPANVSLKNLIIAIDAGHGGTNNGAVGATGVYEKELTLALSIQLQTALQKEGATVIMTRSKEQFFDNKERILFYRDSMPDLLLSIHLNSSEDPFKTSGTSTFYRYIGFKPLSNFIYKRMLQLGLKDYGNNGSFNFMLNSPIEYPNALIETLFLSNLEEEEKILDVNFRAAMADKIVLGVKDFLENCKEK